MKKYHNMVEITQFYATERKVAKHWSITMFKKYTSIPYLI